MFDQRDTVVGLWPGEGSEDWAADDEFGFEITCRELAEGWGIGIVMCCLMIRGDPVGFVSGGDRVVGGCGEVEWS